MIDRDVELACEEIERLEAALEASEAARVAAEAKLAILTEGIQQMLKDMEAVK
jgi:hypothetical protein